MIKWSELHVKELEDLVTQQLFDSKIAEELSKKFQITFTTMSIKRKRHRLNMLKKQDSLIDDTHFYVKLSAKKGRGSYNPTGIPLQIIEKYKIKNKEFLIFRKNNFIFLSKVEETKRKYGQKNGFLFYVPYKLVNSVRYNTEVIEYLGKVIKRRFVWQK